MKQKNLFLFLVFILLSSFVFAEMPEPIKLDTSHWVNTKYDGLQQEYFDLVETELDFYRQEICLYPKIDMNSKHEAYLDNKVQLRKNGEVYGILDPSDLEIEKEAGKIHKMCFTLDSRNSDEVKVGSHSGVWTWINETTWKYENLNPYEEEGFYAEAWVNGNKVPEDCISWYNIDGTYKHWFDFENCSETYEYPLINPEFRIYNYDENLFFEDGNIRQEEVCVESQVNLDTGKSECVETQYYKYSFQDMIDAPENNISEITIEETPMGVWDYMVCFGANILNWNQMKECMNRPAYFHAKVLGEVYNTDPDLELVITTSGKYIDWQTNRTEVSSLGLRSEAPVLFMDFNKEADGTNVRDNSIYNNAGTNNGATYNSSCQGANYDMGGCYEFDGVNDYVNIDSAVSDLSSTTTGTFSVWVRPTDATPTSTERIITFGDTDASTTIFLNVQATSGIVRAGLINAATNQWRLDTDSIAYSDNTWTHVVLVQDGIEPEIYVDGVKVAQTFDISTDKTQWFNNIAGIDNGRIGSLNYNSLGEATHLDGSIDNVQIFDRALTASEILDLYNGSVSGYNNTDNIGKYARQGNFSSMVFYNSTSSFWNVTQSIADSDYIDTLSYVNQTDLVSYWRLDGDVTDSLGVNNGVNNGTTDVVGAINSARNFDGVNDYIEGTTAPTEIAWNNNYSFSLWINSNDVTSDQTVFSRGYGYWLRNGMVIQNSNIYFGYLNDSVEAGWPSKYVSINSNEWTHIVGVNNEGELKIYKNGVESDLSANMPILIGQQQIFRLGEKGHGTIASINFYNGEMDEVMLFNRSLSETEIQEIYDEQKKYYGVNMFEEYGVFDGSNDYVAITSLSDSVNGTIAGWIKPSIYSSRGMIGHNAAGYTPGDFDTLIEPDGRMRWYIEDGSQYYRIYSNSALPLEAWTHAAVQWGEGGMKMYINGVLQSDTNPITQSLDLDTGVAIGARYYTTPSADQFFDGNIDEVLIFNSSLTQAEITEIYNAKFDLDDYTNENLVSHYDMDGNFNDRVGGNDGTASGGAYTTDGLVSYWPLDESFDDLVGGNDGTPAGGVVNATGISSGAMNFDGVDDRIDAGQSCSGTPCSASFWFNTKDISVSQRLVSMVIDGAANDLLDVFYGTATGAITVQHYDGTNAIAESTSTIEENTWYYVTAVWESDSSRKVYINGALEGTDTTSQGTVAPTVTQMGYIDYNGTDQNFLNGEIDEVLVYNRSLSASEIQDLYKAGLSQHADTNVTLYTRTADSYNISDEGLVGLWGLNGNANDELGVNNGTVTGATPGDAYGVVGQGYDFDGVDDYVTISDNGGLTFGDGSSDSPFSTSSWIYMDDATNFRLLNKWNDFNNIEFIVGTNPSDEMQIVLYDSTNGNYEGAKTSAAVTNYQAQWIHVVTVYDGFGGETAQDHLNIFINGINQTLTSFDAGTYVAMHDYSLDILIGRLNPLYAVQLDGQIDEVRIYNRTLSADEIQDLYELGKTHIEWNDWTNEGVKTDGVSKQATNVGKFFQFADVTSTDDTDVSPYVLNYSITSTEYIPPVSEIQNTSYLGIAVQISDINFSSSTPVIAESFKFNSSSINTFYGALNSMQITRGVDGSPTSDVYMRVQVDGTIIVDELIRSVSKGTSGVAGSLPFLFNVSNGEHELNVSFYRTNLGIVQVSNIDFSLGQFESTLGNAGRGNLTDVNVSFASSTPVKIYNKTIDKLVNTSTYIAVVTKVNSSVAQDVFCRVANGNNSPWMGVSVPAGGATRTMSVAYITEPGNESQTNISLECYSNLGNSVDINGRILEADLADNAGNPIPHQEFTNPLTNVTSTVTYSEGDNIVLQGNLTFINGTNPLYSVSFTARSLTGEQTPMYYIESRNSTGDRVCYSPKERTTSGDWGNTFYYHVCDGLNVGEVYNTTLHVVVEAGHQLEVADESGTYFENSPFDIATTNLNPIVTVISPTSNERIYGNYTVNWGTTDPQGDSFLQNITLSNSSNNYIIANNLNQSTFSYTFDTSTYSNGLYNLTVTACENETVTPLCGNKTVSINITQLVIPVITIHYPVEGGLYSGNSLLLNVSADLNISEWNYSLNDVPQGNFTPGNEIFIYPTGNYKLTVFGKDGEGTGNASVNFQFVSFADSPGAMQVNTGMSLAPLVTILGVAIISFILLFVAFKLDEEHKLWKFFIIMMVTIMIIYIPKAAIDSNQNCSVVPVNSTVSNGVTSYQYDLVCAESSQGTTTSMLKTVMWIIRVFFVYVMLYFFVKSTNNLKDVPKIIERGNRRGGKK